MILKSFSFNICKIGVILVFILWKCFENDIGWNGEDSLICGIELE